ncbi:hypothetical protein [Nostoc sp.]|uniref:hypothetical protein n=1 Tax=Nostoc sp. TaxID=1180 RepID=UPI002FF371D7
MGRRKNFNYSPGQLSLFDSSVCGEDTSSASSPTPLLHSQTKQSSGLIKETATAYKVSTKVNSPAHDNVGMTQVPQIPVYVGITFDPCQGIREVKQRWRNNRVPSEVVFDCRPLELATKYACEPKLDEWFEPGEKYLLGQGGLLSNAVFINLLRCSGTLKKWSDDVHKETGIKPISNLRFRSPCTNTSVGKLWEILGMSGLTENPPRNLWTSGVMEFQSRIVTPFLLVNNDNRNDVIADTQEWLDYISDRIGIKTQHDLWQVVSEVVRNIVAHGQKGVFGVSVWPSGHIEIHWTNPNDGIYDWSLGLQPEELINKLLNSKQGAGMPYICDDLLPFYKGLLIINIQTHHFIYRSRADSSIMGLKPRSQAYLPGSIFFTLHLFCPETRNRSLKNVSS